MSKDRRFRRTQWHVLALAALALAGCGPGWLFSPYEPRAKWRDAAERQCLRAGEVKPSVFMRRMRKIREKGSCGMNAPFRVVAVHGGNTFFDGEETLACSMIAATDEWLRKSVQPTAFRMLGTVVTGVFGGSSAVASWPNRAMCGHNNWVRGTKWRRGMGGSGTIPYW